MITKRVKRTTNGSYAHLANYIAAAKEKGEKLEDLWIVNSNGGEELNDLSHAIRDIEATQALNSRSNADQTYHLIASFRDEKPSPEHLKEIEQSIAKALGFEEHQRVVGTHQNTDNFHMHIAYNKIHPETLVIHSPFQDFKKLSVVCREIEQKFDLKVDNGMEMEQDRDKLRTNQAAKDYEAHTWQQSLDSYVKENARPLKRALTKAATWQDFHVSFAEYGLELRPRGNGMIIRAINKEQMVKASTLERSFAATAKKKLGPYVTPYKHRSIKPSRAYEAKPLTQHRATRKLWGQYKLRKKAKASLTSKAFSSWKDFLKLEAINDPLAIAIIQSQKELLKVLTLSNSRKIKTQLRPPKEAKKSNQIGISL